MFNLLYFGKIILGQILAFALSSLLVAKVFLPQTPALRRQFKKSLAQLPKNAKQVLKQTSDKAHIKFSQLANLVRRRRTIALPPPWLAPKIPQGPKVPGDKESKSPQPSSTPPPENLSPSPAGRQPHPTSLPSRPPTPSPRLTLPSSTPSPPAILPSKKPSPTLAPPGNSLTAEEEETVRIINQRRQNLGLSSLTVNFQLLTAARRQSKDMSIHNSCPKDHKGSDGSDPWTRAKQAGYNGVVYGETIGCGYSTPKGVVDGWWSSPPHKAILTNIGIRQIGLGWWKKPNRQTAVVGY